QARETAVALQARSLREAVDALARRARLDLGGGPATSSVLTPREQEVMRLVAQGLTNRQIGRRLFISEKTASVHVSNVLAKLGAAGRTEAVAIVHRRGLLADVDGGAEGAAR
ncbi:MAG: response regulator transcription factor, partial [Kineosporiaceae bacterium]